MKEKHREIGQTYIFYSPFEEEMNGDEERLASKFVSYGNEMGRPRRIYLFTFLNLLITSHPVCVVIFKYLKLSVF